MKSDLASLSIGLSLLSLASASGTLQIGIEGKREVGISPLRKRDTSGTVQTTLSENDLFITYYANITIGTPPQNIRLIVDTGSSDIWAVDSSASVCVTETDGCPGGTFNSANSKTFKVNGRGQFQASYVDGTTTTGDYFEDTFGIGGVEVKKMELGLASNTTSSEGIMGIAFDTAEGGGSVIYPNLVDTMVNESIIATQAYSLWLDDKDARTGSLLFGGIDTGKYEGTLANIAMYPSESGQIDRFSVAFTSLTITSPTGTDTLSPPDYRTAVVLDSGTTLTFLPDFLATAVFNEVGATYDSDLQSALCDCALGTVDGTLNFGFAGPHGPVIKVPVSELVSPLFLIDGTQGNFTNGDPACVFGVGPSSSLGEDAPILFGDTMLRSAYVVYDLQNFRIGLAQTKFFSNDTNVVAFESLGASIPSATTVSNELAVTQTAASGVVGGPADPTAAGNGALPTNTVQYTGSAGPGFATATTTHKSKKGAAGPMSNPLPWEQVTFVGLTVSVMVMVGGLLL